MANKKLLLRNQINEANDTATKLWVDIRMRAVNAAISAFNSQPVPFAKDLESLTKDYEKAYYYAYAGTWGPSKPMEVEIKTEPEVVEATPVLPGVTA